MSFAPTPLKPTCAPKCPASLQARHHPQGRQTVWPLSRWFALSHLLHLRPPFPSVGGRWRKDVSSHPSSHRTGLHRLPCPRCCRPQLSIFGTEAQQNSRGGKLVNALTASGGGVCVFVEL
nr:MAG TPA: hypothetical protein [Caudoviricetes sp.]